MAASSTLRCFIRILEPYYLLFQSYPIPSILNMISRKPTSMKLTDNGTNLEPFSWDGLPEDLLGIICGKLWTGDRVRLRLVCKSWNRVLIQSHIPTAKEGPWEILSNDSYKNPQTYLKELCLKSLSENRIYRFKLPMLDEQLDSKFCLCAHSGGWLVLAAGLSLNPDVFLWNPLSGDIRKLPSLSTLPFFENFEDYDDLGTKIRNFSSIIDRVEIFSVGSVDCVVAALFRTSTGNRMALCTPRELKWTPFNVELEGIKLVDILFHTFEGKLKVAIDTISTSISEKEIMSKKFEVNLIDCQVQLVPLILNIHNEVDALIGILPVGVRMVTEPRIVCRLVESSITHRVLIIGTRLEQLVSRNRGGGLIPEFKCEQTSYLNVTDFLCEKEATVLGAEAIFLGATGSFTLPVVHGIVPDCIYFAIDEAKGIVGEGNQREPYIVRESGQYFLTRESKMMRRNSPRSIRSPSQSKIGWFIPFLF